MSKTLFQMNFEIGDEELQSIYNPSIRQNKSKILTQCLLNEHYLTTASFFCKDVEDCLMDFSTHNPY